MNLQDLAKILILVIILQIVLGGILYGLVGVLHFPLRYVFLAIGIMSAASVCVAGLLYWVVNRYAGERAVRTAMMAMTADEREVLKEIMRQGEVRQDELWRDLDMSRGKLSAIVSNLVEKKAIIKERYSRTNILSPMEAFRSPMRDENCEN